LAIPAATAVNIRVYIDECGILREYFREYAYAPSNEKAFGVRSGRNRKLTNIIGALCNGKHIGIECYEHTTKAAFFEDWFSRLLPQLPGGCAVILDNASFHRKEKLEKIIKKSKRKITLLFLPPYSPDFNPIEKSWANLKVFLRNYGQSFNDLYSTINSYFHLA
jgi:transposase